MLAATFHWTTWWGQPAQLWRVDADGTIRKVPFEVPWRVHARWIGGSTEPLPSPDRRQLAFVDHGVLCLHDVETGTARRVDAPAVAEDGELLLTAWSPNGTKLLGYVVPAKREVAASEPGYRVYDLVAGTVRPEPSIGERAVSGWLPDGSYLVHEKNDDLRLVHPDGSLGPRLGPPGRPARAAVRGDGRAFVTTVSDQVVAVELATGGVQALTSTGVHSSASYSPDDTRIAWLHKVISRGEESRSIVEVDGRPLYDAPASRSAGGYHWVDRDTIMVIEWLWESSDGSDCRMVVVDVGTGAVKGEQSLLTRSPEAKKPRRAATPTDWQKLQPMPAQTSRFPLDARFSDAEMEAIRMGLIPREMEDRWFLVYDPEAMHLRAYRSWTSSLIFEVQFAPDPGGWRVAHVTANRDPAQSRSSDDEDRFVVTSLLRMLLEPLE